MLGQRPSEDPGRNHITQRISADEITIETRESGVTTVGNVDPMNRPGFRFNCRPDANTLQNPPRTEGQGNRSFIETRLVVLFQRLCFEDSDIEIERLKCARQTGARESAADNRDARFHVRTSCPRP